MVVFKALVYYVVPLGFIASFYIVMAHHLVLSTRNMPGEAQGQGRQIQARKKVNGFFTELLSPKGRTTAKAHKSEITL